MHLTASEPPTSAPDGPPVGHAPVVTGENLTMRFGAVDALRGVDLAVAAGESVAIMGPSGSGKSTLLHCLAAITAPTTGRVLLDGTRIDHLSERRRVELRRQRFGFVFQAHHLVPELPADENVALPLLLAGTRRREAVTEARRWFAPLGLAGRENHRPGELSGGEAQRVAIARSLVARPSVVFADEPTAALDQATGDQVLDLLVATARAAGSAVVLVTHNPAVAARCQRIVHLRDGLVTGIEANGGGRADLVGATGPVGSTGSVDR